MEDPAFGEGTPADEGFFVSPPGAPVPKSKLPSATARAIWNVVIRYPLKGFNPNGLNRIARVCWLLNSIFQFYSPMLSNLPFHWNDSSAPMTADARPTHGQFGSGAFSTLGSLVGSFVFFVNFVFSS